VATAKPTARRLSCLALPLLVAAACGSPPPVPSSDGISSEALRRERRDLLLITVDTLRWDATGFSGAGRVETPTLDRLAAGGTAFTSARAHAVVTLPSHATLLTGRYPYEHGIHDNAGFVLAEGVETLATLLRAEGYATAAFVSALPLDRRYGLDRGFEVYDDEYEGYGDAFLSLPERPGDETVARALAWWNERADRRRFLWVHLFTPHFPYAPDEPFASRYRDAPYFGDVAMMDHELEPLLGPLLGGDGPRPLVVFTSDHGEALGEHGEQTHGTFAYDSTLKVPLVFWAPQMVPAGARAEPVWHADVLPSVLDLLDLDPPAGIPGRPLFDARRASGSSTGYFEALSPYFNRAWAPLTGRMVGARKAIRLPLPELYDLQADPGEERNLADGEPAELERLLSALPPLDEVLAERETVDPETLERLRGLGYLADNVAPDPAALADPSRDPKNLVELERLLDAALTSYRRGETDLAVATLRDLLRRQPDMRIAHAHLANMLVDLGRVGEAIDVLGAAERRGVSDESIRRSLALARLRAGQPQQAWETLRGDQDSRDPETLAVLGRILAQWGRPQEARRWFERALEIDPTYPPARVDLAILLLMRGRPDEARPALEAALRRDPFHAEGWNALGVIHLEQGRLDPAIQAFRRAIEADPRLPDALFNLAAASSRAGRVAEAITALERYSDLVDGDERRRAQRILADLRARADD
jgi:arylsulfatase A-like enzyme/Flp pilus assembly protein TadD